MNTVIHLSVRQLINKLFLIFVLNFVALIGSHKAAEDNIKVLYKYSFGNFRLSSRALVQTRLAGFFEHGNERFVSLIFRDIPDLLRSFYKAFLPRSHSVLCVWHPYFFIWRCGPKKAMPSSFLRFLDHTQRRSRVCSTPLYEWPARRRDLCLKTDNSRNTQTSMSPTGFEPTTSTVEWPQTHALDSVDTDRRRISTLLYVFSVSV